MALVLVGVLLGGCGVSTETGVTRDADGPPGRFDPGQAPAELPRRESTSEPEKFIDNYLKVASSDPKGSADRQREFLDQNAAQAWQPDLVVTVVRKVGEYTKTSRGGSTYDIAVKLQPVGTLTEFGAIDPPANRDVIDWTYRITGSEPASSRRGLYVTNPRPQILLLETALTEGEDLYWEYPIYFWDNENQVLVPDLRYLSLTIPVEQRPTEVLRWLLAGPSALLRQTTHSLLPAGTELRRGNVYLQGDDRLIVDLNSKASGVDLDLLMPQLRWSLWRLYKDKIGLLIEGQTTASDDVASTYQLDNAAAAMNDSPDVLCVSAAVVREHCETPGPGNAPAAVAGDWNRNVVSAAISIQAGRPTRAALVRTEGRNGRGLWIGQLEARAIFPNTAALHAQAMSRPVWLRIWRSNPPAQTGLVAADGRLYRFGGPSDNPVSELTVPVEGESRNLTRITAVAAAPDARRIALVAGGQLYVAALLANKGTVTVGAARPLLVSLSEVSAVAFNAEDRILAAGLLDGKSRLTEVTVDGGVERLAASDLGLIRINQLVAYPDDPYDRHERGFVLIDVDGYTKKVFSSGLDDLDLTTPKSAPFYVD